MADDAALSVSQRLPVRLKAMFIIAPLARILCKLSGFKAAVRLSCFGNWRGVGRGAVCSATGLLMFMPHCTLLVLIHAVHLSRWPCRASFLAEFSAHGQHECSLI